MATITKISPLAPARFPDLPAIDGVRLAATEAGVKYRGRKDVMLAEIAPGSAIAGVFTRSSTRSANVLDCQRKLGAAVDGQGFAFVVNSGNSNAFTGRAGDESVARICEENGGSVGRARRACFHRLHWRDRRATSRRSDHGGDREIGGRSSCGCDGRRSKRDHDNRHLCEGGDGDGGRRHDLRLCQGIGHDRAGYGDDAGLHLHRRANRPKRFAGDGVGIERRGRSTAITVDSDTSTSDTLLVAATSASGVDVSGSKAAFAEAHCMA